MRKDLVEEVLEKHEQWLNDEKTGYQGNFRNKNLELIRFEGKDLTQIEFRGTKLAHSKLMKCKLDRTSFWGADLEYARLMEVEGEYTNFWCAKMCNANLQSAKLHTADFRDANLQGANFKDAELTDANFMDADVRETVFKGAKIKDVRWTTATMMLLAKWGECSDKLTTDLMLFDASNHPDPKAFDKWTSDENSPYSDAEWDRTADFKEKVELWPGSTRLKKKIPSALDLFNRLLKEHCIAK